MDFNEVIKIFCDKFNLSVPLSSRAQNALYEIKINGKDELYLLENEDRTGVCLYSILFPVLSDYKDKISSKINELNAFGKVTKTAVISYSKDDRAFVLSEQFAYENTQKEYFINRIGEFYSLVNYFKEEWPKWQLEALTTSEKHEKRPTGKNIDIPVIVKKDTIMSSEMSGVNNNSIQTNHTSSTCRCNEMRMVTDHTTPEVTSPIQQTPITSASIIQVSNHIAAANKQVITQYKTMLDLMRSQIPSMRENHVPVETIQSFISSAYSAQLGAVFIIAANGMDRKCPIGDDFAVLGLGSLGRGNVSLYSDLDFAIVVENSSPEVEQFFIELLTHVNQLIEEYHDEGLVLCKGHITPPHYHDIGGGDIHEAGSKELFGTPEKLANFTLLSINNPHMLLDSNANSLLDANIVVGNPKYSNEFTDHLKNAYSKPDPQYSQYNFTHWQSMGLTMLKSGGTFWKNLGSINNLKYEKSNPPSIMTNPCCNIKESIIRPLQNSIQGLALFYGIRESNTLKALDLLIQNKHIDKALGEKLRFAYEFTTLMRLEIELATKGENFDVTCCPNHFLAKQKMAMEIDESTRDDFFKILETLEDLQQVIIELRGKYPE